MKPRSVASFRKSEVVINKPIIGRPARQCGRRGTRGAFRRNAAGWPRASRCLPVSTLGAGVIRFDQERERTGIGLRVDRVRDKPGLRQPRMHLEGRWLEVEGARL